MKAITVTTDNVISVIDIPQNGHPLYDTIRRTINGYMENVYPTGLPEGYVMIVDEEGKLKGKPVNPIGSILYGSGIHGDYIVGDIIILKLGYYESEPDVVGIPDEEANELMKSLFLNLKGVNTND